jgi:hypothetical protein
MPSMLERIVTHTAQRTVFPRNRSKTPRREGRAAAASLISRTSSDMTESRRFAAGDASLPPHAVADVSGGVPRIAPIYGIRGEAAPPRSTRR